MTKYRAWLIRAIARIVNFFEIIFLICLKTVPGVPRSLQVSLVSITTVKLQWSPPSVVHGPLTSYKVNNMSISH